MTTGGQTFHTRRHLCTQCLLGQQAREKEWVWIIKFFFPYVKKKIRHASGNVKPGIQTCHLDIYHGACLHTFKRLSLDCFQRGEEELQKGLSF